MGFFYDENQPLKAPAPEEALLRTSQKDLNCFSCPLNKESSLKSPKMKPYGSKQPLLYILGSSPTSLDDKEGTHFSNASGQFMRRCIPTDFKDQVRFNYTTRCYAPKPSTFVSACCRNLQVTDIEATKPRAVLGVGPEALHWVTGKSSASILAWRGRKFPVQFGTHTCWYFPVMAPEVFIENESYKTGMLKDTFEYDLTQIFTDLRYLTVPKIEKKEDLHSGVKLLTQIPDILSALKEAETWDRCAIDIETNALRPYFKGKKILTIAISNGMRTFAFPYAHPLVDLSYSTSNIGIKKHVKHFLLNSCAKTAHNLNFELEWLATEFGQEILWETEWDDTLAQAYILDEREGAKELDDLTLLYFGFRLKLQSKDVSVKHMQDNLLEDVLAYNALDAKYTARIAKRQLNKLKAHGLLEVYKDHVLRSMTLVWTQMKGLVVNNDAVVKLHSEWSAKRDTAEDFFKKDPEIKRYTAVTSKQFNPTSSKNVLDFFKFKSVYLTSTDEAELSKLKDPAAAQILKLRKASKILSTYVLPLLPQGSMMHEDGKVHTNYNHCFTRTRRLSSDSPNNQNFPNRTNKSIREVIGVPKDHLICSIDYGQLEARVIAMASKDPTLVKETRTSYDIHGDWTEQLARRLNKTKVATSPEAFKEYRSKIKNGWTFPLFFGSSARSVAVNLSTDPDTILDLVDAFWDKYPGVKTWQKQLQTFYEKNRYIQTLTGFRRRQPLSWNEIINTPIQGTGSDIVVDAMCRLGSIAYHEDIPALHPVMNIHDDLTFYFPENQAEKLIDRATKEMLDCAFPFINVPLTVEVSIGSNWFEQEAIGTFTSNHNFR